MAEKKSLNDRIKDVQRWLRLARKRFYGARKALRDLREDIAKTTKELRDIQGRIKHAQGGVLDDLRAKEARLKDKLKGQNAAQDKLAVVVATRGDVKDDLTKKLKHLKAVKEERQEEQPPSGGGNCGFSTPVRRWNPYNRQIPNWMIPWLDKSDSNGWDGVVVSGVRTPAYSQQLCYNMCGAPTCSGTCAGIYSNHNMSPGECYPEGALDVSDYYTFERVQFSIGSPLKNNLPNDLVHFSVSGN